MKRLLAIILLLALLPVYALAQDSDNDGLADEFEIFYYTDSLNPDTDGDGYTDGIEIKYDYSPHQGEAARLHEHDYDGDGLNDWLERWFGTDLGKSDSDKDSFTDYEEVMYGYDPADPAPLRKFVRRLEVDRAYQRVYYFVDGVKLLNLPASTGNPGSETPAGEFAVLEKIDKKRYQGQDYDLPNVLWNLRFDSIYYIHGAYWHNDFGVRTHSHGCVNLRNEDAEVLYKYVDVDLPVTVTGTTPSKFFVNS